MNRTSASANLSASKFDESSLVRLESLPQVSIYASGSRWKNKTGSAQAGAGVVLLTEDRRRIKLKACCIVAATNRQAAIASCAVALESLQTGCRVSLYSDSEFVADAMLGKSEMIVDRELWSRLIAAALTHSIEWNQIPKTVNDAFQQTAEKLARAAAIAQNRLSKDTLDKLADLLQGKPNEDTARMIHNAVKTLAARCDGARKADGQGFNKFDSEIGKRFALKSTLTAAETAVARTMLTKYLTQIVEFDQQLALLV